MRLVIFACFLACTSTQAGTSCAYSSSITVDTRDYLVVDRVSFSPLTLNPGQQIKVKGLHGVVWVNMNSKAALEALFTG
jgi:hypothetical protein